MKYDKEDNIDFSEYSTTVKPIAIYKSDIDIENNNVNINNLKFDSYEKKIKRIKEEINLAKSHGIYGFAFYYSLFFKIKFQFEPDIILQNKNLEINFFLIFSNNPRKSDEMPINFSYLFDKIKNYIVDERYIKFNNKYVIGITDEEFSKNLSMIFREKFNKSKLGDIFILLKTNNYNQTIRKDKIYDGFFYLPSFYSLKMIYFQYNNTFCYFYSYLIYHNLLTQDIKKNNVFRTSVPMNNYPIFINETKSYLFSDYSPEKFYFLSKVILNWTKTNYDKNNQYIFINDFFNLYKGAEFGYANINSFSKALYGLPLIMSNNKNFNIHKLYLNNFILVQAHIYYTELLEEIVNKTNNIPVPFDLYITTDKEEKKIYIENFLKKNSKTNKFKILITKNKGRDIIPCLIQLKDILMKYKYFCHIHTKKHGPKKGKGKYWQQYLFENLLGNKNIIIKILSDFENNKKLGFIFPEPDFFHISKAYMHENFLNYYYMHKILDILFPNKDIWPGNILAFPVGNMFWSRTKAIYQIFNEKIIELSPEENGALDGTILHAIERIWLYLVKLNGFKYKTFLYYI